MRGRNLTSHEEMREKFNNQRTKRIKRANTRSPRNKTSSQFI